MTVAVEDFLSHVGVKGMKWGVRKDGTPHTRRSAKKEAKADQKWEKSIYSMHGAIAVHNHVADQMNSDILPRLNGKSKYKDKNLYDDPKLEKEYMKEYEGLASKAYSKAVTEVHGVSPSGKKAAFYVNDQHGERIEVRSGVTVEHAETDEPDLVFLLKRDANGLVLEMNEAEAEVKHSDEVEDFFAHYGVQGMKWGVRRSRSERLAARSAPSEVREKTKPALRGSQAIKVTNRSGGRVSTRGGKRNIASEEAVRAAVRRQKAKGSSVRALSNKELKETIERMNLEQQYSKLAKQADKPSVKKFIDALMGVSEGAVASSAGRTTATQIRPKAIGS